MSHFTTISTKITDLEILARAVKNLGLNLEKNSLCRYYSGTEYMDLVVRLPGAYDVGFVKQGNGYAIKADFWGGHVEQYVGAGGNTLLREYAVEKAKREAYERGLAIAAEEAKQEKMKLTLMDPETGGTLELVCDNAGKITVAASGFQGESCMKFKELEEALGAIDEMNMTGEYYIATKQQEAATVEETW